MADRAPHVVGYLLRWLAAAGPAHGLAHQRQHLQFMGCPMGSPSTHGVHPRWRYGETGVRGLGLAPKPRTPVSPYLQRGCAQPHTPDLGSQTPDPGSGDEPLWASAVLDLKPVRLDTPDLCPLYWAPGGAKTAHLEGLFETHYGQVQYSI